MSIRDTIEDLKNLKKKEIEEKINEVKELTEGISHVAPSSMLSSSNPTTNSTTTATLISSPPISSSSTATATLIPHEPKLRLEGQIGKSNISIELTDKYTCNLALSIINEKLNEYAIEQ